MTASSKILKDWVSHNPRLAVVLNRFNPVPVSLASTEAFLSEIMRVFEDPTTFHPEELQKFPLPVILDYLYRTHQYYLSQRLPEIEQSADALIADCGEKYPILSLLVPFLAHYRRHLESHIRQEEASLFPYLSFLYLSEEYGEAYAKAVAGSPAPIALYATHDEHDHQLASGLKHWRQVIEQQHPALLAEWPCQVLFHQLDALSTDIALHERLEEEVLIPLGRALAG
ncbi:MAG: hemerythrin domain-containing protein [Bacteroidia bacterium]|nr:hemerythrin domain-containing protein [Bacteroidia bacterium]